MAALVYLWFLCLASCVVPGSGSISDEVLLESLDDMDDDYIVLEPPREEGEEGGVSVKTNSSEHMERVFVIPKDSFQRDIDELKALKLRCQVVASQPVELRWYKNEAPVETQRNRVTIRKRPSSSILRIKRPTVHDSGYYRCDATNKAGSLSAQTIVKLTNKNVRRRPLDNQLHAMDTSFRHGGGSLAGGLDGACEPYRGSICAAHLPAGAMVWVNRSAGQETKERILRSTWGHIANSKDVNAACRDHGLRLACLHVFRLCDSRKRQPVPVCRSHCKTVEGQHCEQEYKLAKSQGMMDYPLNLLPHCERLPPDDGSCAPLFSEVPPGLYLRVPSTSPAITGNNERFPPTEPDGGVYCYHGVGRYYNGKVQTTLTSRVCEPWTAVADSFPAHPELQVNYCRNPDGDSSGPYCYVKRLNQPANSRPAGRQTRSDAGTGDKSLRREKCQVPVCPGQHVFPELRSAELEYLRSRPAAGSGPSDDSTDGSQPGGGILGLTESQYILIGGAVLGLLLFSVLAAAIYYCVRGRKPGTGGGAARPKMNGYIVPEPGTTPKPLPNDRQMEMSALLPRYTPEVVPEIHASKLRFVERLGAGNFNTAFFKGEYCVEHPMHSSGVSHSVVAGEPISVIARVLDADAPIHSARAFAEEARVYGRLGAHGNVVRFLGASLHMKPLTMVWEYMVHGDLHELLLLRSPYRHALNHQLDDDSLFLDHSDFLHIAIQIAKGMEHLASRDFVHRDLATRNCLVTDHLTIKIGDFAVGRAAYAADYFRAGGCQPLPVRWLAPEALQLGRFSEASDVWAFGVTLWELYAYGAQPYGQFSNTEAVELVRALCLLECPDACPPRIYALMLECWQENGSRRPRFAETHARLQQWAVIAASPAPSAGLMALGLCRSTTPSVASSSQPSSVVTGPQTALTGLPQGLNLSGATGTLSSSLNHSLSPRSGGGLAYLRASGADLYAPPPPPSLYGTTPSSPRCPPPPPVPKGGVPSPRPRHRAPNGLMVGNGHFLPSKGSPILLANGSVLDNSLTDSSCA